MTNKTSAKKRKTFLMDKRLLWHVVASAGLLLGTGLMQSCEKDILTGQPEWLGNSIYERLQEGIETTDGKVRTFNTTLRLIDDLQYTETLSKTGSKTVFATPDDVFDAWFAANHITYEQLSENQKKSIFKNSMVNNAYLLELMSNVAAKADDSDPIAGSCMRRETSVSIYDSIPMMKYADMPVNPFGNEEWDVWSKVRSKGKDIYVMKDATTAPMIHFLPKFMANNAITSEDLKVISNGESESIEDSWINGKKVISDVQTCKNGYIYVVDGVISGSPNMAQAIREQPNTKMWSQAIDRFSCPVAVTGTMLSQFQNLYNTNDTVYNLRYLNSGTNHLLSKNDAIEDNVNSAGLLRFDPGWNQYFIDSNGQDMHYDAGIMIVPTDEALKQWFESGGGKDMRERFGTWENVDYEYLAPLLNVNMLESFIGSVPSKFEYVLDNTSQKQLGIQGEDIVKCIMCCNGVVYIVNKVFTPDTYSTVINPANLQSNGTYSVIYHALSGNYTSSYASTYDFSPYLSAMDSRFSFIIPFNTTPSAFAVDGAQVNTFRMIDPCSYGQAEPKGMEFYYAKGVVGGISYPIRDGVPVYTEYKQLTTSVVQNRLNDLLDNNIIIDDLRDDQKYYQTKAGSIIKAYKDASGQHFEGGYQIEMGETIMVPDSCIVDKGEEGNGITYGVCSQGALAMNPMQLIGVPQTAQKTVYQIVTEAAEEQGIDCKLFLSLLKGSELLINKSGSYSCAGQDNYNISIFDSYNYTVYVPTDNKIKELIDGGYLPTWAEYEALADAEENGDQNAKAQREAIADRINSFLRYHIQDKTVMIGGEKVQNGRFESGKLNTENSRFYYLTVSADNSDMTVTDYIGNTRHVVKDNNFYNKISREYWISGTPGSQSSLIATSSNAVVHQIDGVLLYSKDQLTHWNVGLAKKRNSRTTKR